jgi:NADPH-dependent glutamate synthase beta subunit-like oxidoreductase
MIGAHQGVELRIEGEDAPNVLTGIDFLHRVNAGESVDIGHKVVVIGGGDTAIDAARMELPVEERLKDMVSEVVLTHIEEDAIEEAKRCMSCGKCFECGTCWSFCQDNAIVRPLARHGEYKFKLEYCTGCKKCPNCAHAVTSRCSKPG